MSARSDRNSLLLISAGLVLTVFLVYAQVAQNGFVSFDDGQYVADNPHVRGGLTWEGIGWAFTTGQESNWHPLTWLSLMLDVQLFGLDPAAHHRMSVVLHAANAVLALLLFFRMTRHIWPSALVAALFAIHPLRVESVAWISARKDVLSGLFFFLTLLAYTRYVRRRTLARYALLIVAFVLGLMSKPMLVTLPLVLLLLDVWPLRRLRLPGWPPPDPPALTNSKVLVEKVPLLVLAAASCAVTFVFQQAGGAVLPWDSVGLTARLANAIVSYVAYIAMTVWPSNLAILYPHPALIAPEDIGSLYVKATIAGAALVAVTVAVWLARRRRPYLAVGWLWYLGMLVPVLGVVQVGVQARADRYTYLPLIGIYLLAAWGLRDLWNARPVARPFVQLGLGTALAAFCVITWVQVGTWKDSISLYRHALAVTRSNYTIHNNLGSVLPENSEESAAEYRRAIAIKPDFAAAHYNLGTVLESQNDLDGARDEYEQALRLKPDWFEARNNLAILLASQGNVDGAMAQWREWLRVRPSSAQAHERLGKLLLESGDVPAAIAEFEQAIRIEPLEQTYVVALAEAKEREGGPAQSRQVLEDAARLDPENFETQFNLAVNALRNGKPEEAERVFQDLVRSRPDDPLIHHALGTALAQQQKFLAAEMELETALRLNPDLEQARLALEKVRRLLASRPQPGTPSN